MAGSERGALAFGLLFVVVAACSRSAEIADEPDGGWVRPAVPRDESPLTSVDPGFATDAFTACGERPYSNDCQGINDFPCNFEPWVAKVVTECQTASSCMGNGRVVVRMGDDGCVADLLMSEPNTDFVRCASERFGAYRCQCRAQTVEDTLGYGNTGCPGGLRCSGETVCPPGERCVDGYCESESAPVGGAPG